MTTIWMDPADLRAGATVLGRAGVVLRDTAMAVYGLRGVGLPTQVAAQVEAELTGITEEILRSGIVYLQEAVDVMNRAIRIEADQAVGSTVGGLVGGGTSWAPVTTSTDYVIASGPLDLPAGALLSGSGLVGGVTPITFGITSGSGAVGGSLVGGPTAGSRFFDEFPLMRALEQRTSGRMTSVGVTPSLLDLNDSSHKAITEMLRSRTGASYDADSDTYTDRFGRSSSFIRYNPATGEYEA